MDSITDVGLVQEHEYPNLPSEPGEWAGHQGSYFGPWPIFHPQWPHPSDGEACVYYLYDHSGLCRYVGRTTRLRVRLGQHAKDGKVFAFWVAQTFTEESDLNMIEAVAINMNWISRDSGHWNKARPRHYRSWYSTCVEQYQWAKARLDIALSSRNEVPF